MKSVPEPEAGSRKRLVYDGDVMWQTNVKTIIEQWLLETTARWHVSSVLQYVDCCIGCVHCSIVVQRWCVTTVKRSLTRRDVAASLTLTCFITSLLCASLCQLCMPTTTTLPVLINSCLYLRADSMIFTLYSLSSLLTLSSFYWQLTSTSSQKVFLFITRYLSRISTIDIDIAVLSICLSVCPSVTFWYSTETT